MPTWPYRGDIPYLRMLLVFELIGMLCVAALVVFGILRATTNNRRCSARQGGRWLEAGRGRGGKAWDRAVFGITCAPPPPTGDAVN